MKMYVSVLQANLVGRIGNKEVYDDLHGAGRVNSYIDFCCEVIAGYTDRKQRITNRPMMNAKTRRSARAARPAVRQTFAARKAKAADSGGGSDSDGPCRPQHTNQNRSTLNPALSTVRNGGAK